MTVTEKGYCHIPASRDAEGGLSLDDWCKQITVEKLVTHYVKGQPVRTWHKPDKARNEALDCRVYALAALKIMQPSLRKERERMMNHPRAQAMLADRAKQSAPVAQVEQHDEAPVEVKANIPAMGEIKPRSETSRIRRSPAARRVNWVNGWK